MKKISAVIAAAFLLSVIFATTVKADTIEEQFQEQFYAQFMEQYEMQLAEQIRQLEEQQQKQNQIQITDYERGLLEMVAMNEAGNQGIQGMRYVVSCILNRVDSSQFPNTIEAVVYQPNQFTTHNLWNISNECKEAVELELQHRSDTRIIFFCSTGYNYYGTPLFRHGGHWFSSL